MHFSNGSVALLDETLHLPSNLSFYELSWPLLQHQCRISLCLTLLIRCELDYAGFLEKMKLLDSGADGVSDMYIAFPPL